MQVYTNDCTEDMDYNLLTGMHAETAGKQENGNGKKHEKIYIKIPTDQIAFQDTCLQCSKWDRQEIQFSIHGTDKNG